MSTVRVNKGRSLEESEGEADDFSCKWKQRVMRMEYWRGKQQMLGESVNIAFHPFAPVGLLLAAK
jgi:hypothetical protein